MASYAEGDEIQADTAGYADMIRWPSAHLMNSAQSEEVQRQGFEPVMPTMQRTSSMFLKEVDEMLVNLGGDLLEAAMTYQKYGLQQQQYGWSFREWVPFAEAVYLVGDFNGWEAKATPLAKEATDADVWACEIRGQQAQNLQPAQKYKVYVEWGWEKSSWLMPSSATRMNFTWEMNQFDAIVCPVAKRKEWNAPPPPAGHAERIYECHLGSAFRQGSAKSFAEAAEVLIPRAAKSGYTALLLLGVQECKVYADMGAKPCAYFAPTSALGTPEDLQKFVFRAHEAGLRVYMSPGHEGAAWGADCLPNHYFKGSTDPITGARIFDYKEPEVVRYLLSNLAYWMIEYGFDGFRFDSLGSIIYANHGRWLPWQREELDAYVKNPNVVNHAATEFLILANSMVHELAPEQAITIADESSLFPGLCDAEKVGGLGFDLRQRRLSYVFHGLLQQKDEDWKLEELVQNLSAGRPGEAVVACVQTAQDYVIARKPLKIAMLAWETLHTIAMGGVAPHVTELAGALRGAGHEVHIFTRAQGGSSDHEILGVHYHEVVYDKAACLVQDAKNMCEAFVHALGGHESVWGAFDVVHGHDWLVGPGIMQLRGEGKRCVFTMHSTEGGRNGDMAKGHPLIKDIERSACGAAEKLICVSGVLRDEVCGVCGADGNNITVIYNGIHAQPMLDMQWEDDWSGNAKEDKGFGRMDPTFLFVGRHTAQKGCDILIEAIPHILQCRGDAKFVIVGDGHLLAHNQSRVAALGVGDAVRFTGSLKSGTGHLKALFRACDAVVVPSRNEPFGIVVLEAWASGKPVVATRSGGPRDFVTPGEDGYLVDPDPGSIAWGCCKILENFEHSKWMGRSAQAKALRDFSWEHIAQQTEEVYYSLLGLSGAPRGRDALAGRPLAYVLLREFCFEMCLEHSNPLVARGTALLKVFKLLAAALGDGLLSWMGSEFGQIDPVDMPRPGNGFDDERSRTKFELSENADLKFAQLAAFEATLNHVSTESGWAAEKGYSTVVQSEVDKVLALARRNSLFVFNLHPTQTYAAYSIPLPASLAQTIRSTPALNTEDARFGGCGAPGVGLVTAGAKALQLTLAPRSGLVFTGTAADKSPADKSSDILPRCSDSTVTLENDKLVGA